MIKITEQNFEEYYRPHQDTFVYFGRINDELTRFSKNSNIKTFNFIFGDDGERLFQHFKIECGSTIEKFYTYLTRDQRNIFLVSIYVNRETLYSL